MRFVETGYREELQDTVWMDGWIFELVSTHFLPHTDFTNIKGNICVAFVLPYKSKYLEWKKRVLGN